MRAFVGLDTALPQTMHNGRTGYAGGDLSHSTCGKGYS